MGQPAALSKRVSALDFRAWLATAIGVSFLASLPPILLEANQQFDSLDPTWRVAALGTVTALSLVIAVALLLGHSLQVLALGYPIVVLIGLITWPWAWVGPQPPVEQPWIWAGAGMATVCVAFALGVRWALGYAASSSIIFAVVRHVPDGDPASWLTTIGNIVNVLVLPTTLVLVLHVFLTALETLDTSSEDSRRAEGELLLDRALAERRRLLDGIIHDEVMTALVAAVHTERPQLEVSQLARRALKTLEEASGDPEPGTRLPPWQFLRLIQDMVAPVCPEAVVSLRSPEEPGWRIDARVAGVIGQAVREACLNAHRHAAADRVQVTLSPRRDDGRVAVGVTIDDDGVGFVPTAVPAGRLGLKVSIAERIGAIGGRARVRSSPRRGTTITLDWVGETPPPSTPNQTLWPVFSSMNAELFVALVWLVVGIELVLAGFTVPLLANPGPVILAQGLAVAATALALGSDGGSRQIGVVPGSAVVASAMLIAVVVHLGQHGDLSLGPGGWHAAVVEVLLVVLLVRGRPGLAWTGVTIFLVEAVHLAVGGELDLIESIQFAFVPVLWLTLASLILREIGRIGGAIARTDAEARESSRRVAAGFSSLVLREVWLRDLITQVGPLLEGLADPGVRLTTAAREAARVAEGRLRDALRAGNLVSLPVADAIQRARGRGVDVVLVDNRGSALPEVVRFAALDQLEQVVTRADAGRIVARSAPIGADVPVTILTTVPGRAPELVTIDGQGGIAVRTL